MVDGIRIDGDVVWVDASNPRASVFAGPDGPYVCAVVLDLVKEISGRKLDIVLHSVPSCREVSERDFVYGFAAIVSDILNDESVVGDSDLAARSIATAFAAFCDLVPYALDIPAQRISIGKRAIAQKMLEQIDCTTEK